MNAVSSLDRPDSKTAPEPLTLRVLTGRSEGAEHRLPNKRKLLVGHSFENDIVLRDASTHGCALELTTCGRRGVVKVISGGAEVLGRAVPVGETIQIEPYLPVRIGEIMFAIGSDDEERWADAALASTEHASLELTEFADAERADLAERLELRAEPMRRSVAGFSLGPRILAVAGTLLLTVAAGALFGSGALGPSQPTTFEVEASLAELGYPGLVVEESPASGEVSIVGLVRDDSALAGLREWSAANFPGVVIGVETVDGAAEAATDLLIAQNVDARAVPDGTDALIIEGAFLPQDRQMELTDLLRRDVPRVRDFTFRASPDRGEADLAYFFNAPGYGAASFVSGDPGYIVTEDGTRWFEGASLPTGHTIIEIANGRVTVEREGLRDILTM